MSFKKRRGIKLPYRRQGLIAFTCWNYDVQPDDMKKRIRDMCDQIGGEYADALFEVLTTEQSVTAVALKHYISKMQLYNLRVKFYESWVF